jgi:hypothetical protein
MIGGTGSEMRGGAERRCGPAGKTVHHGQRAAPIAVIPAMLMAACLSAAEDDNASAGGWWTKERKALAINLALDAGVVAYGFSAWDWGTSGFFTTQEGWFGSDTRYGGADKIGHAFTGYLIGELLTERYQAWGYDAETATALGAGSSVVFTTLMELGDGISADQGFSPEDLVMNLAGAGFSWVRRRLPGISRLVDFRIEYFPSDQVRDGSDLDITTDYDGMKHLLACKLDGFPQLSGSWLRFVEVHAGYYTRGYADDDEPDRRTFYGAIGLNIGAAVASLWGRTEVFSYYQVPYTYLPVEWESPR